MTPFASWSQTNPRGVPQSSIASQPGDSDYADRILSVLDEGSHFVESVVTLRDAVIAVEWTTGSTERRALPSFRQIRNAADHATRTVLHARIFG